MWVEVVIQSYSNIFFGFLAIQKSIFLFYQDFSDIVTLD